MWMVILPFSRLFFYKLFQNPKRSSDSLFLDFCSQILQKATKINQKRVLRGAIFPDLSLKVFQKGANVTQERNPNASKPAQEARLCLEGSRVSAPGSRVSCKGSRAARTQSLMHGGRNDAVHILKRATAFLILLHLGGSHAFFTLESVFRGAFPTACGHEL